MANTFSSIIDVGGVPLKFEDSLVSWYEIELRDSFLNAVHRFLQNRFPSKNLSQIVKEYSAEELQDMIINFIHLEIIREEERAITPQKTLYL